MFDNVRADMKQYEDSGGWHRQLGFYVTATYRFGHWSLGIRSRSGRLLARCVHGVLATPWRFFRSVSLPAAAEIGPGLRLIHAQSILVAPDSVIGHSCSLYQEVTLGTGSQPGVPSVGDHTMIFAGAKILGGIHVGSEVQVGANAVVTHDVPDGATVAAPPGRVIPREMATLVRRKPLSVG